MAVRKTVLAKVSQRTKPKARKGPVKSILDSIMVEDLRPTADIIVDVIRKELARASESIVGTVLAQMGFGPNPWLSRSWNMTRQGQVFKNNPIIAALMANNAGHKKAFGSSRLDARDYRHGDMELV